VTLYTGNATSEQPKQMKMNMSFSIDKESFRKALEESGAKRVAFVHHLKIGDLHAYRKWLNESNDYSSDKRMFAALSDDPRPSTKARGLQLANC
jgi:hypothetical protein